MDASTEKVIKDLLADNNSLETQFKQKILLGISRKERDEFLRLLANNGWDRKYFYDVCMYITHNENLSENEYNLFESFFHALTGFCHSSYWIKLPNDPKDPKEFGEYIFSDWWKNK